jgi:CTP synthase (UTP-ammonia lyase)
MAMLKVGLVGDRDDTVVAHRAIPLALAMAAEACGVEVEPVWLPTDQVGDGSA